MTGYMGYFFAMLCTQADQNSPHRRSNSQKAWTGTNPITQRYSQQNGNMPYQKQSASPRPSKESNTSDNHAHDRLLFLVTSFIVSRYHSTLMVLFSAVKGADHLC